MSVCTVVRILGGLWRREGGVHADHKIKLPPDVIDPEIRDAILTQRHGLIIFFFPYPLVRGDPRLLAKAWYSG